MYKELTADDFRKDLNLPHDYKVDGVFIFGSSATERIRILFTETLEELFSTTKYEQPLMQDGLFSNIKVIEINGRRIWFDVVYGGAYLSELLHIACLLGSKCNILAGMCGGLQKEIHTNDVILPKYTFGNESSTRAYTNPNTFKHYSNSELTKKIAAKIDYTKVFISTLITHQAMLGESIEDIEKWASESYAGVEMETSTVFAVSNYFKVKSAAILQVADNLAYAQTVLSEEYKEIKEKRYQIRKKNIQVALETLIENI